MITGLCIAILALAAGGGVAGTWNMGLQGDHVIQTALVLAQDGTSVTGTVAMPTQHIGERIEVPLNGDFVDGVLTLSGTMERSGTPITIELTARLGDQGTLEGTLKMPRGTVPWTAERLRERKKR